MKALGVSGDNVFWWTPWDNGAWSVEVKKIFNDSIPTWTSGELGEMLKDCGYVLPCFVPNRGWEWSFWRKDISHTDYSNTEADARAQMLIYLIKQKLVSIEEINRRAK